MTRFAQTACTAFEGARRIVSGPLADVALHVKKRAGRVEHTPILVFDDVTSEQIEIDFRGTAKDVLARLAERTQRHAPAPESASEAARGPGRPKLGVVAREVTLLPRHWEWLSHQPGGASVALRKLV